MSRRITIGPDDSSNIQSTSANDVLLQSEVNPNRLSTPQNLLLLFLYTFFTYIGTASCEVVGTSLYFQTFYLSTLDSNLINVISNLMHLLTQLTLGALGDKYSFGQWGRRKLYIAIGYVGQALSIFFLFRPELFINTTPTVSNGVSVANDTVVNWYFAFQIINSISNALILVPYQSWLIESAVDNSDYLKVQGAALPMGLFLGGIIGLLLSLKKQVSALLGIYLAGGSLTTIGLLIFLPSKVTQEAPKMPPIIPSFQTCMGQQEFQMLFLILIVAKTAWQVYQSSAATFVQCGLYDYINLSTNAGIERYVWQQAFWQPMFSAFTSMLSTFLVIYLLESRKYDKKELVVLYLFIFAAFIVVGISTTFSSDNASFWFWFIWTNGYGIVWGIQYLLQQIIIIITNMII